MRTKQEIVSNWLPRYTGVELGAFKPYVLLTNFSNYLDLFVAQTGAVIYGENKAMPVAIAEDIIMINYGMGSANAATVMDLLTAIDSESGPVPRQMRRAEEKERPRRPDPSHCRHSR